MMRITVCSILTGRAAGHLIMQVPATHTIKNVLDKYCSHKGTTSGKGYVIRSRDNLALNLNKTLIQAEIQDGDTLMLGLSDDEEHTFSFGSWWFVTFAAFLIGTVGLVFTLWTFFQPVSAPQKFGVVIDAGSSHSELFVFTWSGEKPLGTADVKLVHRCFEAGGINSFATHADDLGKYYGRCIGEAETHIPQILQKETPLYVGATAGMRILRDFDPEGAVAVLATLHDYLITETPFMIDSKSVDILQGSQEGTSGWIAVNYLLDRLKQENGITAAALDVGGASMQFTSVVSDAEWSPSNLTLFNKTHEVKSQSFLCYGIGEARHRYEFLLTDKNGTILREEDSQKAPTIDPCLAKGTSHEVSVSDLSGPCTLTDDSKPNLTGITKISQHKLKKIFKNLKVNPENENQKQSLITLNEGQTEATQRVEFADEKVFNPLLLEGSSNASECNEKVRELFDLELCKRTFKYGDCLDASSVPALKGDMVAFSGLFYHLMTYLGVGTNSSLAEYKQIVFDLCSLNSTSLNTTYPGIEPEIRDDLCFDAMFVYNLLTDGLGINDSTWENVQFTDQVKDTDIEWPLGFMMNQTTSFPSELPHRSLTLVTFILLSLLFVAFIVSGITFLRHSIKIKKASASYQRFGPHQA